VSQRLARKPLSCDAQLAAAARRERGAEFDIAGCTDVETVADALHRAYD
jgi:hypothetical protein